MARLEQFGNDLMVDPHDVQAVCLCPIMRDHPGDEFQERPREFVGVVVLKSDVELQTSESSARVLMTRLNSEY